MTFQPLAPRLDVEGDGQRNRLLVADAALLVPGEAYRRGERNLRLRIALNADLRRHTGIAGIAPIGFPAGAKFDLQGPAHLLFSGDCRIATFDNNTHTPARSFGPGGS